MYSREGIVQSDGFWVRLDGGLVSRSLVYMLEDRSLYLNECGETTRQSIVNCRKLIVAPPRQKEIGARGGMGDHVSATR
jgi:hypothetical protein